MVLILVTPPTVSGAGTTSGQAAVSGMGGAALMTSIHDYFVQMRFARPSGRWRASHCIFKASKPTAPAGSAGTPTQARRIAAFIAPAPAAAAAVAAAVGTAASALAVPGLCMVAGIDDEYILSAGSELTDVLLHSRQWVVRREDFLHGVTLECGRSLVRIAAVVQSSQPRGVLIEIEPLNTRYFSYSGPLGVANPNAAISDTSDAMKIECPPLATPSHDQSTGNGQSLGLPTFEDEKRRTDDWRPEMQDEEFQELLRFLGSLHLSRGKGAGATTPTGTQAGHIAQATESHNMSVNILRAPPAPAKVKQHPLLERGWIIIQLLSAL